MTGIPAALPVPLAYPVHCGTGALGALGAIVQRVAPAHRVAIITDTHVAAAHGATVEAQLRPAYPADRLQTFVIPPGEQEKTRARWGALTDALIAWDAGRDTTIIALGGGVIGDLAGFVAATYMRGLPVVQVPTTLLAMVDASVGGKTAVDTPAGKNLVGAFHNPAAVVIDPAVLATLPGAVFRSGLAEMLKHGVIADASYFDRMLQALPSLAADGAAAPELTALIAGSIHIKADVVAEDTREGGLRQILNAGHTIAHAIERLRDYAMLHGEAVAMGLVAEARIAEVAGVAQTGLSLAVADAVDRAGLPRRIPADLPPAAVVAATHGDKKARAGSVRYALPRGIGEMEPADGRWAVAVSDEIVIAALRSLNP